jgi:HTH-type transcriptional regulator / antitoxin HipB
MAKLNPYSLQAEPIDVKMMLAERVRVLRKRAGYSQLECAERSGMSQASLKRFEQTGEIALTSLLKIMRLLDRLDDMLPVLEPGLDAKEIDKMIDKAKKSEKK